MTENEWDVCTDIWRMLRFLLGTDYPRITDIEAFPDCRASDRKLRLFACHCYDRIRHLPASPLAETTVEVAERYAEGQATLGKLRHAHDLLRGVLGTLEGPWRASQGAKREALLPVYGAAALALQVTRPEAPKAAYYASSNAYWTVAAITNPGAGTSDSGFSASEAVEKRAQVGLLRDLVGPLPFRPVRIEAAWLSGTVMQVARAIYEERRWDDMPVLADALTEAGCDDAEVLGHCRGAVHARGCWVVDLLTGKE